MLLADSNNAPANNYLGYFYADRGVNLDLAVRLVSQALSVEPLNGAYLDSLGWALFKKAKAGDSLSMEDILRKLQRAAELDHKESGGDDPVILDHIAVVCFCLGKWEEAKEKWEASLARAEQLAKERPNALPNAQQVRLLLAWVTHALDQEGRSRRLRVPISKRAAAGQALPPLKSGRR
jgi:tetratricopeptide (TPR) repeat protein